MWWEQGWPGHLLPSHPYILVQSSPFLRALRNMCSCFNSPRSFSKGNPNPHKIRHQHVNENELVHFGSGSDFTVAALTGHWQRKPSFKAVLKKSNLPSQLSINCLFFKAHQILDPIYIKYQLILLRQFLCLKTMCCLAPSLQFWMEKLHILLSFEITYRCPTAVKTESAYFLYTKMNLINPDEKSKAAAMLYTTSFF